MRETDVWKWLKKARLELPGLHMVRIENPISSGFPDVEGWLKDYGGFTLELKNCFRPVGLGKPLQELTIRPRQLDFLDYRARCGGSAWMLIKVSRNGPISYYLIPGNSIEFLRMENRVFCPITEARLIAYSIEVHTAEYTIRTISENENMAKYYTPFHT